MSLGGSPETPAIPLSTRLQGEKAVARMRERQSDGYVKLERRAIDEARKDRSGLVAGRGSADLAMMEAQAPRSGNAADAMGRGIATAASGSDIATQSKVAALNFQDQQKLGVVQTGQGKAKNADAALNSLSNNAIDTAFTSAQAANMVSNSKLQGTMNAAQGVVGGLFAKGHLADTKAGQFVQNKVYTPVGNLFKQGE